MAYLSRESPSRGSGSPDVVGFHDPKTGSIAYIVSDPSSKSAAIIDPVLGFDEKSGRSDTDMAEALLRHVDERSLKLEWTLDTHPHADHLSAAAHLKRKTSCPVAIGDKITRVQEIWTEIYGLADCPTDGSQWDHLFAHEETFRLGEIEAQVMFSPGHTAASVTYIFGDAAFIHDTLFMPDSGTARCDFPGGDAHQLYRTIQAILALPSETRLFVGHDYSREDREPQWESSVAEQRASNIHVGKGVDETSFVAMRMKRDATLPLPNLMLLALQVNINAGRLPPADEQGRVLLRYPVNARLKSDV
jgi:glyoxylase-like metal-dependent hydrolase (beta-lactamase superfamily II)